MAYLVVTTRRHQRVPESLAKVLRDVNLVSELADEADTNQTGGYAGNGALANTHVGERFCTQVDVLAQRLQHEPCFRSGDIDAAPGGRNVGDINVETPLGVPLEHVLIHTIGTACRGRHIVVAFVKSTGNAVVDNRAGLVREQCIARATNRLLRKIEGVDSIQKLAGVGASHFDAAEG